MDPYVQMVMAEQAQARQRSAAEQRTRPARAAGALALSAWRAVVARFRPAPPAPLRVVKPVRVMDDPPRQQRADRLNGAICIRCAVVVPADDIALHSAGGRGLCLFCYGRETGTGAPVPASLRRQILAVLAAIPPMEVTNVD